MSNVWRRISRTLRSKQAIFSLSAFLIFLMFLHTFDGNPKDKLQLEVDSNIRKREYGSPNATTTTTTTTTTTLPSIQNDLNAQYNVTDIDINPYPFQVVMSTKPCYDEQLVIIVHSAVQYYKRRMLMRYTWLNRDNLQRTLSVKVKIVFMTGMSNDSAVLTRLDYEQEMYDDIVQSNFTDSYMNNTYKAISFLKWVSSESGCPNASLILKVDDDALIHAVQLPKLNRTIHKVLNEHRPNVYLGKLLTTEVNRDNSSKWYVPYDLWPYHNYPVWFQGLAYMITPKLAAELPDIALKVPYLFTDDVYVGILVSHVKDVDIIGEPLMGAHTLKNLSDFVNSFLNDGAMFYHVPSVEYFFKWYHINERLIRLNPRPRPVVKKKRKRRPSRPTQRPLDAIGVVMISVFILAFFGGLLLLICFLYQADDELHALRRQPRW